MTDKTTEALKLSTVALKDIACTSQTDDLLWWQIRAREALAAVREALVEHEKQEPVAVISESAIGLVKLHSNGVSLPFGTQLYAAPVERQWVDLTDDEMWDVFISKDWTGEPLQLMSAVIAAFKEKNK